MSSDNEKQGDYLIYGVWYGESMESQGRTLVLRRESLLPHRWGQFYEFQEDGQLIDAVSARCGNQPGLHAWSGKWEIDRKRNLLRVRIEKVDDAGDPMWGLNNPSEDYKRGREFIINELTEQRMVLSSQSQA